MFPILTKCIFVIFDEMTNVKIKPGRAPALVSPINLVSESEQAVQVLAQFMIIKRWPGLFVRTFHIKYFDNTNQVSGK